MKNKMVALITGITGAGGWGEEQTKGTLRGAFWGAVIGGVTGHQSGKRDEGLLIGTAIGGLIGNKSGKGKDESYSRNNDPRYDRYERSRRVLYNQDPYGRGSYNNRNTPQHVDPEIVEARHRAELAEKQLQREMERRQAAAQRAKELDMLRAREEVARKRLNDLNK